MSDRSATGLELRRAPVVKQKNAPGSPDPAAEEPRPAKPRRKPAEPQPVEPPERPRRKARPQPSGPTLFGDDGNPPF